ncbi:MAG: HAD-IIIA family hydrolase [Patescibacteria group bacterium]
MRTDSPQKKIITLEVAQKMVRAYKKQGLTIGAMSGSFDIVTAYHFKSLEECSKKSDVLFLFLNSDASVKRYKGTSKPILHESERAYTIAQSPFVHHIVVFDDLTPVNIISRLKPDIFINVSEWGKDCVERKTVESYGGQVAIGKVTVAEQWVTSTSDLIKKIINSESKQTGRAIFLDRDGVINENKTGYLFRWEDIVFMPHLMPAFKAFVKAGYKLIIITNQSGIARGYYTEKQMVALHVKMTAYFKKHGVTITAIYHCPHGPIEGCTCRKPGIGMLVKAATEQNLNLSKSWFIGDSHTDVEAGRFANVKTVYIGNEKTYPKTAYRPNFFVSTMKEAASCILPKK